MVSEKFSGKRRILSQNTVKIMLMNRSLSGGKICPVQISFTSPQHKNCGIAIILQFLVDIFHSAVILVFLDFILNFEILF